ncbi:MAG: LemA family protein [Microcystaceae cyanobacterium]
MSCLLLQQAGSSSSSQKVEAAWTQVENQLQRRADLIPNLSDITKAQAQHKQQIITLLMQSHEAYLRANNLSGKERKQN